MEKLRQMGEGYLSKISNFTIGRSGFGEVTFLEPVDVTGFDLNDLFGKVVVFTEMELAVYPDDWEDKPPQGKGLNHPARITLLNCYPRDKATKQFITDLSDPRHARFLKRVKNIPETEFVSYTDDGAWTFEVKHFSKYGLRDGSDDDEGEVDAQAQRQKQKLAAKGAKAREAFQRTSHLDRTPSRTPESGSEEDGMPPTSSIRDAEHDSGVDEDETYSQRSESHSPSHHTEATEDAATETESSSSSAGAPPGYDAEMEERRNLLIQQKLGHEGMVKLREMQGSMFGFEKDQQRPPAQEKRGLGMRDTAKRTLGYRLAGFGSAGEDEATLGKRASKVSP
jgi:nuclear pore complex protein Nup98-Nup96